VTVSFSPPFSASVSGTVAQAGTATAETVTLDGSLTGEAIGHLTVTIEGTAVDGGGVRMKSGTVAMGPADEPTLWSGPVTRLTGDLVVADLTGPGSAVLHTSVQVDVTTDRTSFTGTVTATGGS
jgi:ethanolamine utilization microcompartment shell protein EutS